mmetsp:Transcript_36241/g.116752  ORF Transcript_36241/g.116752 Transcript_36241/m.116752 type:complete len:259 (+) Transcript_36241:1431-2207(+)
MNCPVLIGTSSGHCSSHPTAPAAPLASPPPPPAPAMPTPAAAFSRRAAASRASRASYASRSAASTPSAAGAKAITTDVRAKARAPSVRPLTGSSNRSAPKSAAQSGARLVRIRACAGSHTISEAPNVTVASACRAPAASTCTGGAAARPANSFANPPRSEAATGVSITQTKTVRQRRIVSMSSASSRWSRRSKASGVTQVTPAYNIRRGNALGSTRALTPRSSTRTAASASGEWQQPRARVCIGVSSSIAHAHSRALT